MNVLLPCIRHFHNKKYLLTAACSLWLMVAAMGQNVQPDHDSTYYASYKHLLTGRFYFSKKYTNLLLGAPRDRANILYRPNTTLNMGIGATYQSLSLNLAYGFEFLNHDQEKGKTRYLDLQSHIYGRKWTIDLFGQFYKGYYLSPRGFGASNPKAFYLRPDLHIDFLGLAVYRVLNEKRFSYPAAFLQSEWQKKSAGSFIVGGEMYYGAFHADSSLVPGSLSALYPQSGIQKVQFLELGPGAGYAYTLVVHHHLFLTGSLTLNLDLDFTKEFSGQQYLSHTDFTPNVIYRLVAGYNSNRWDLNFSVVNNTVTTKGSASDHPYQVQTGNYRLTLAHRFIPGPKLKKRLHLLDRLLMNK